MSTLTRRAFLRCGMAGGAALFLSPATRAVVADATTGLAKYVQPVPVPGAGIVIAGGRGPAGLVALPRENMF